MVLPDPGNPQVRISRAPLMRVSPAVTGLGERLIGAAAVAERGRAIALAAGGVAAPITEVGATACSVPRTSRRRSSDCGVTSVPSVGLLGGYSNPDIVARLERILAGQKVNPASVRTVRSPRQRQRRLGPDEVLEMVGLREAGSEIDALAVRFGVHRTTVMNALQRAGVAGRRAGHRELTPERLVAAGRLYETGVTLAAVGEQFGVDRRYLRRELPKVGFPMRRPGQRKRG